MFVRMKNVFKNCILIKRDMQAKQALFDRMVKCNKRLWQRQRVYDLEEVHMKDPNAFWATIKNMRSGKCSMPCEVSYGDDITVICDPSEV